MCIVSSVTLSSGVFVCYVGLKRNLLNNLIWKLLISLTISDTMTALTAVPTFIAACFNEHILDISWICHLNVFSTTFLACNSIYAIVAISICKYRIVNNPFLSLKDSDRSFLFHIAPSVFIAICLSFPPMVRYGEYKRIEGNVFCLYSPYLTKQIAMKTLGTM